MNMLDKFSENFTTREFFISATALANGLSNYPVARKTTVYHNLRLLCEEILQPLRDLIGRPISITSGYRSIELNRLLNGSKNSQHMTGEAADISTYDVYGNMVMVIKLLCVLHKFDQLIMYRQTRDKFKYAWLHVSYKGNGGNRRQVMMCYNGEYSILGIEEQQRLVFDLSEQFNLRDNN